MSFLSTRVSIERCVRRKASYFRVTLICIYFDVTQISFEWIEYFAKLYEIGDIGHFLLAANVEFICLNCVVCVVCVCGVCVVVCVCVCVCV